ncbi:zf-CCCH domain-containing protein [Cephalotus follicularis]|uniref:Zf-CCCH domain-containing protein n=1 Tax=Cephalotus follicularis TaxID=3775 RepID=A0A1Q3D499_CEPFO|nr:zf-CCCH domain-containing protein [Cephalotus follicularis]
MEEEMKKRNTDCVYFLASPLTCKKGADCEYRHSEIARFNPRDCWYWLAANCLNPTCAFRHPPLEAHVEAPFESAQIPYQSSVPIKKTGAPCYFYLNGFCNKGVRCSFSHGPDGSSVALKCSKTDSRFTDALSSENKTSTRNDTASALIQTHLSLYVTAPTESVKMALRPKEYLHPPSPKIVTYSQASSPQCKELSVVKSAVFLPEKGSIEGNSHLCMDQSSDEQGEYNVESEERWESSPGFDVLVNNKSENLSYKDDPEHSLALDLSYDLEDPVEYEPTDAEILYQREIYDFYECTDNGLIFDEVSKTPGHSRDRMLGSVLSRKRKVLLAELADHRQGEDLRDQLRKRRVIDGHPFRGPSRRHDLPFLVGRTQERPRKHGMGRQRRRRLASGVRRNVIVSLGYNGNLFHGASQHGWLRCSHSNGFRRCYKEKRLAKRQFLSSDISKEKSLSGGEGRSTQASSIFTGPKTLAQIKEEKNNVDKSGNYFGRATSADFEGPKPLNEILQDKKRLAVVRDDNTSSN